MAIVAQHPFLPFTEPGRNRINLVVHQKGSRALQTKSNRARSVVGMALLNWFLRTSIVELELELELDVGSNKASKSEGIEPVS